ncbi:MAG TPA: phosphoribosylamine--glycine ligase [Kiritimatiellia bacterium]|nr:phosphoribosylamine--glycine ligase [Kiritimatiellia bacterium]
MNTPLILIVGGGGREHALAWKLSQDSSKPRLFCAPGNAGTAEVAQNLPIAATDLDALVAWAVEHRPYLTVIGPEAPLCAGLADRLLAAGLRVFGPNKAAAQLEGSKVFSKDVMVKAGVPTAKAGAFTEPGAARAYARSLRPPLVVKADGLAAGKGVLICQSLPEAENAIDEAMVRGTFGAAGSRVLVEEFLDGEEASILALTDGGHIVMLASAQDHKRIYDRDQGPNTGGMGAYSPAPVVTDALWPVIRATVFEPTLRELRSRGITYRGVLYAGLMLTRNGPQVLEFNCRFGDPETQVILPRWKGDLLPALDACADGVLRDDHVNWHDGACVCVVISAGGYPGAYKKGDPILGLADAARLPGVVVFHAGTRLKEGAVVTDGGRVLGVTATGAGLRHAVTRAYDAAARIRFANAHYRKDIAWRALGGAQRDAT